MDVATMVREGNAVNLVGGSYMSQPSSSYVINIDERAIRIVSLMVYL
jgi:hypothetical protein